jgi:hypothetical protein
MGKVFTSMSDWKLGSRDWQKGVIDPQNKCCAHSCHMTWKYSKRKDRTSIPRCWSEVKLLQTNEFSKTPTVESQLPSALACLQRMAPVAVVTAKSVGSDWRIVKFIRSWWLLVAMPKFNRKQAGFDYALKDHGWQFIWASSLKSQGNRELKFGNFWENKPSQNFVRNPFKELTSALVDQNC